MVTLELKLKKIDLRLEEAERNHGAKRAQEELERVPQEVRFGEEEE